MSILGWILVFCFMSGVLSVLAAAVFLLIGEQRRTRLLPHSISFAIGALLGAALLGLLPQALAAPGITNSQAIPLTLLLGLLGFFVLEKMVLWRHCHSDHCEVHVPDEQAMRASTGVMILVGDSIHNFVDGILIGAAFLTDIQLGIVTSLAVAAHEIPQEVGDFVVLLHSGFSRSRAFLFNILSSLAMVIGGVLAYYSLATLQEFLPYVLAIAASSFLYIAVADLIPGLHKRVEVVATVQQVLLIGAGVFVIYSVQELLH